MFSMLGRVKGVVPELGENLARALFAGRRAEDFGGDAQAPSSLPSRIFLQVGVNPSRAGA
jgi:hypothetical protein